ncbi:MAG: GNAT family N-acetyltransferase [Nitrospirae bacterium]|nr:MAG: GNAT family N-acetyltransferase [Nitrospirota bacterium]
MPGLVSHRALDGRWRQALLSSRSRGKEHQPGAPFMIRIRPATEAHFTALLQIQQAAFGEYANVYQVSGWTTETLDSLRQDAKEKHIFVAEAEGVVVGSVRFWIVAGVCVIRLLSVSPAHQSQGVGKALIREIERVATDAHKFFACTMLRTARNIHMFMSLGYKAESILPDHYNHLDLICFAKYR